VLKAHHPINPDEETASGSFDSEAENNSKRSLGADDDSHPANDNPVRGCFL
jgi:hypothetical protein